ncbi:MAG: hypothetical protein J0I69_05085 [Altererythrobacter sp.]|nr:hypothetical protein [Altererythrobacter sp.]
MQSVNDWRSPHTDDDFANLDLTGFAQEFLRRNPGYCREYHALARSRPLAKLAADEAMLALAHRWGLSFPLRARPARRRRASALVPRSQRRHRPARRRSC